MKIAMYDLEGHLLEVFVINTVVELEKKLLLNPSSVSNCIDGKAISNNGRQFKQFNEKSKVHNRIGDVTNITRTHLKPVHKYYQGKYICTYESSKEAAIKNKLDDSAINKCCNGKYKSTGGFEWEYVKENF
jgi:hypothetical protein